MALQTLLNVRSVIAVFGTGGILAGVVFLGVGVAVGWVLGGSTRRHDPSWGWERRSGTSPPHSSSPTRASTIPNVGVMVVVVAIVVAADPMPPLSRAMRWGACVPAAAQQRSVDTLATRGNSANSAVGLCAALLSMRTF